MRAAAGAQCRCLRVQALTYNKMAPMALGRIDIKYRRIACQVPQALDVIVDENRGAGGWIRLQVKVRSTFCFFRHMSMSACTWKDQEVKCTFA